MLRNGKTIDSHYTWDQQQQIRQILAGGKRPSDLPECLKPKSANERSFVNTVVNGLHITYSTQVLHRDPKPVLEINHIPECFTKITLPASKPLSHIHQCTGGGYRITLTGSIKYGLPYGRTARLLLIHLCTQIKIQKRKHINQGNTLREFIASIGLIPIGGKRGNVKSIIHQFLALSHMTVSIDGLRYGVKDEYIIKEMAPWISRTGEGGKIRRPLAVRVENWFYELCLQSAIKLDPYTLCLLSRNILAIDIYIWLRAELSVIETKTITSWLVLHSQFSSQYKNHYEFRRKFKSALAQILNIHPTDQIHVGRNNLVLYPR